MRRKEQRQQMEYVDGVQAGSRLRKELDLVHRFPSFQCFFSFFRGMYKNDQR